MFYISRHCNFREYKVEHTLFAQISMNSECSTDKHEIMTLQGWLGNS